MTKNDFINNGLVICLLFQCTSVSCYTVIDVSSFASSKINKCATCIARILFNYYSNGCILGSGIALVEKSDTDACTLVFFVYNSEGTVFVHVYEGKLNDFCPDVLGTKCYFVLYISNCCRMGV